MSVPHSTLRGQLWRRVVIVMTAFCVASATMYISLHVASHAGNLQDSKEGSQAGIGVAGDSSEGTGRNAASVNFGFAAGQLIGPTAIAALIFLLMVQAISRLVSILEGRAQGDDSNSNVTETPNRL